MTPPFWTTTSPASMSGYEPRVLTSAFFCLPVSPAIPVHNSGHGLRAKLLYAVMTVAPHAGMKAAAFFSALLPVPGATYLSMGDSDAILRKSCRGSFSRGVFLFLPPFLVLPRFFVLPRLLALPCFFVLPRFHIPPCFLFRRQSEKTRPGIANRGRMW